MRLLKFNLDFFLDIMLGVFVEYKNAIKHESGCEIINRFELSLFEASLMDYAVDFDIGKMKDLLIKIYSHRNLINRASPAMSIKEFMLLIIELSTNKNCMNGGEKLGIVRAKVYVCSPFKGIVTDYEKNLMYTREAARSVFNEGDIPIVPHMVLPQIMDDKNDVQRTVALEMGLTMLEFCDRIEVFCRYGISSGMINEVSKAYELNIPVLYYDLDDVFSLDDKAIIKIRTMEALDSLSRYFDGIPMSYASGICA